MTQKIARIGIVEDNQALLDFLCQVVDDAPDLSLAFSCTTTAATRDALAREEIDLCLVDLDLPDGSGIDIIRQLKTSESARTLVLSVLGDRVTVMQALMAGADGYILKSGRPTVILNEIRQTLAGLAPVSPQIASYLLELVPLSSPIADETTTALSARETEVLNLFSRGLSYRETAKALGITANTVSDYVRKIYTKLSVHSRSEAVFEAQTLGLIANKRPIKAEETGE